MDRRGAELVVPDGVEKELSFLSTLHSLWVNACRRPAAPSAINREGIHPANPPAPMTSIAIGIKQQLQHAEAGSGASSCSASEFIDAAPMRPSNIGQQSDAPAAYTQSEVYQQDV